MKKEEKTKKTNERIIQAAIQEFGSSNFDQTSINHICKKYEIPKGLLYHHFKSKDELYLTCVERCFKEMTLKTNDMEYADQSIKENIEIFLTKRQTFFKSNPFFASIFFNAILHPPKHLSKEINTLKQELDQATENYYKKILEKTHLRENITIHQAIEYLMTFQEMFNIFFQHKLSNNDFKEIIKEHELNLIKILDIILYGIAEK